MLSTFSITKFKGAKRVLRNCKKSDTRSGQNPGHDTHQEKAVRHDKLSLLAAVKLSGIIEMKQFTHKVFLPNSEPYMCTDFWLLQSGKEEPCFYKDQSDELQKFPQV